MDDHGFELGLVVLIDAECDGFEVNALPEVVEPARVEPYRSIVCGLEGVKSEETELLEVGLQEGFARLGHVAHLERALQPEQDGHELLVQLSIGHHNSLQRGRLQELDYLRDVLGHIADPAVRRLEKVRPDRGQVLQSLESLDLDRSRLLVSNVCHQNAEQVLDSLGILDVWRPALRQVDVYRLDHRLVEKDASKIETEAPFQDAQRLEQAFGHQGGFVNRDVVV